MLKKGTLIFVCLVAAGMAYELTRREAGPAAGQKLLRVGAEGWQINEFKLYDQVRRFAQEHPDIRIELHQLPSGYETILMLQASIGEVAYDLILSGNNYNVDRYYVRKLSVPPLAYAPAGFDAGIMKGLLYAAQVQEKDGQRTTYLVPYMGEVQLLNYRKDLFEQAGISRPPATWQEFEQCAEKLKAAGGSRYPCSLNVDQGGFFLQNTYLVLLQSLRGSTTDESGHLALLAPESAEAFRMVKRWWKKGLISPASRNPQGASDDFKMGLTAMYPHWQSRGLWAVKNERLADKIGFAPVPEAQKVGSLVCVYGGLVLKSSRVQKEAVQFMTEAMCGYGQKDIIASGKMPVRRASYVPDSVPDWMIQVQDTLERGYTAPDPLRFTELAEYVSVAFHKFLATDDDDPMPMLEEAQRECQRRVYSRED